MTQAIAVSLIDSCKNPEVSLATKQDKTRLLFLIIMYYRLSNKVVNSHVDRYLKRS